MFQYLMAWERGSNRPAAMLNTPLKHLFPVPEVFLVRNHFFLMKEFHQQLCTSVVFCCLEEFPVLNVKYLQT